MVVLLFVFFRILLRLENRSWLCFEWRPCPGVGLFFRPAFVHALGICTSSGLKSPSALARKTPPPSVKYYILAVSDELNIFDFKEVHLGVCHSMQTWCRWFLVWWLSRFLLDTLSVSWRGLCRSRHEECIELRFARWIWLDRIGRRQILSMDIQRRSNRRFWRVGPNLASSIGYRSIEVEFRFDTSGGS